MRNFLALILALAPPPVAASTGTCYNLVSGPPAAVTVVPVSTSALRILFSNSFGSSTNEVITVGDPIVTIVGTEVLVSQSFDRKPVGGEVPPIGFVMCQHEIVDIASLPNGQYNLVWTYAYTGPGAGPATARLPFSLPSVAVPMLGPLEGIGLVLVMAMIGAVAIRR
jgi:hypothetical protein